MILMDICIVFHNRRAENIRYKLYLSGTGIEPGSSVHCLDTIATTRQTSSVLVLYMGMHPSFLLNFNWCSSYHSNRTINFEMDMDPSFVLCCFTFTQTIRNKGVFRAVQLLHCESRLLVIYVVFSTYLYYELGVISSLISKAQEWFQSVSKRGVYHDIPDGHISSGNLKQLLALFITTAEYYSLHVIKLRTEFMHYFNLQHAIVHTRNCPHCNIYITYIFSFNYRQLDTDIFRKQE